MLRGTKVFPDASPRNPVRSDACCKTQSSRRSCGFYGNQMSYVYLLYSDNRKTDFMCFDFSFNVHLSPVFQSDEQTWPVSSMHVFHRVQNSVSGKLRMQMWERQEGGGWEPFVPVQGGLTADKQWTHAIFVSPLAFALRKRGWFIPLWD